MTSTAYLASPEGLLTILAQISTYLVCAHLYTETHLHPTLSLSSLWARGNSHLPSALMVSLPSLTLNKSYLNQGAHTTVTCGKPALHPYSKLAVALLEFTIACAKHSLSHYHIDLRCFFCFSLPSPLD